MENIDIDFSSVLNKNQNPHHNRQQILQKYFKALQQFKDYAERTYNLRPYLFDNYILFHYFQQQQQHYIQRNINQTDKASSSTSSHSAENWIIFLKMELLNHILDRRRQIMYWLFYLLLLLLCIFVYRYKSSTLMAERGVQSILYPGMRMWRHLTLPLIQRFPRLTELYDESCLMGNPFFQVDNLNCKSCEQVDGVIEITNNNDHNNNESVDDQYQNVSNYKSNKQSHHINDRNRNGQNTADYIKLGSYNTAKQVPFTFKNNHSPIDLIDFYKIYINNREIFQRDAYRVQSTNPNINNLEQLFNQLLNYTTNSRPTPKPIPMPSSASPSSSASANEGKDIDKDKYRQSHTLWRCNRMLPARLLRQLIPRPKFLPNSLAIERFVAIDTPHASSYTLPHTECPHVYIQQLLGARFIILRPTSECRQHCRTLSIRLPQAFVLSYNWWYWKPISAPDSVSDTLSISLIGSYC